MLLCTSQRRRSLGFQNLSLSLNGDQLKCVTSHKILGVILDNNLSWDLDVNHVCSKLASIPGLMWRYQVAMDHEMKKIDVFSYFVFSYFVSQIEYCLNIWGSFEKGYIFINYNILKFQSPPHTHADEYSIVVVDKQHL